MPLQKLVSFINIWIGQVLLKRLKDNITKGLEKMEKQKLRNPVAKNCNKFNKPATHKDRKRAMKQGYVKHGARLGSISYLQ